MKEPEIFKNLEIYDNLCKIILENPTVNSNKLPYYVTKKQNLELVKNYLREEDISSEFLFEKLLKENKIKFDKRVNTYFNRKNNKIYINHTRTIDDSLSLVHEFTHFLINKENREKIYNLFSEVFPYTEESKFYDYITNGSDSKAISAINIQMINNSKLNIALANDAKCELNLYKNYKENNGLNFDNLNLKTYNYLYGLRNKYSNPHIDEYGRYMFGVIIGIYLNNKLRNKDISKGEYKELKNFINTMSIEGIGELLELNMSLDDGLYISDDSIEKINKVYKLEVKSYNEK